MRDTRPTQLHRTPAAHLSPQQRWRRALAVVDRSGLVPVLDRLFVSKVGRERQFSGRALLVCLTMHALDGTSMLFTDITATAGTFTPAQLRELGMSTHPTYQQIWEAYKKVTSAIETGTLTDTDGTAIDASTFTHRLITASIPDTYTLTDAAAIDGTDYETWSRRRTWGNRKALESAGTPAPADTLIAPQKAATEKTGIKGADGRKQHTLDPDARDGYRTGHNGRQGDVYTGYELHLSTQVRVIGGDEVPHLLTGATITPAGSHRGTAAVQAVDAMKKAGIHIAELCADRGYTPVLPEKFVIPMWKRGITVWGDLTSNQRGQHPGPIAGTLWIDGTLYTAAMPDEFREHIPAPSIGATTEQRNAIRKAFDKRLPYQFRAMTKRDADGYQRMRGPAVTGHVRCNNNPKSIDRPFKITTTNCVEGEPCACGKTVTITSDMHPRERQDSAWGSTDWATAYYRRVGIESLNAELKTHRIDLKRGYTRVFGLVKNTLLLAFAFTAVNIKILAAWHAKRGQADPWATALNEPTPPPVQTRKTRTRRRTRTFGDLIPPDPGDPTTPTIEVAS